jgi:hypothetical protein
VRHGDTWLWQPLWPRSNHGWIIMMAGWRKSWPKKKKKKY